MRGLPIVAGLLVAVAVIGTVVTRGSDDDSVSASDSSAARPASQNSEVLDEQGVQDVPDPVRAAAAAVALTGDVVVAGFISRRELIESFTTAAFAPRLADATSDDVASLMLGLGGDGRDPSRLRVIELPVTSQLTSRHGHRATVEVWSVMVAAAPDVGPGRQAWRTVSLDLELVNGRWLVDGWASQLGPTPALAPESPIASSDEILDVLSWPQAGASGGDS